LTAVRAPTEGEDRRLLVVAVLAAAMGLAVLPSVAIGVLAPFLIADLDMSRAGIGLLAALTSGVAAALSPAAGVLADRLADRTALLGVVGTGIAGLAAMAAAWSSATMAVAMVVAGLCRAGSNPATNRTITGRVPHGRRGWVTGIKQSGETVAFVVASAVLPAVALAWGWRSALLLLAALACLAPAAVAAGIRAGRVPERRVRSRRRAPLRSSIHWLAAYSVAMGAGAGCVTTYLPLYAHEIGGLTVTGAGAVVTVAGVVATVTRVAWSRLAESRLTAPAALLGLAALALLSTGLLLLVDRGADAMLWVGAAGGGASGLGFGSVCMLAVMAESDEAAIGRASGLVVLGFGAGNTLAPPLFGGLVGDGQGYGAALALVAFSYAAAVLVMAAGRPHFRSMR
jgi:predicted MFS family arabinose efflux permease